jgi:hypothetical protein
MNADPLVSRVNFCIDHAKPKGLGGLPSSPTVSGGNGPGKLCNSSVGNISMEVLART